jgi:hypothetical protein
MKANTNKLLGVFLLALALTSCMSTFELRMIGGALDPPRLPNAKEVCAGLEVSIEEYFSSHKARRAFDSDLAAHGVLPVLVHISNGSDLDYRLQRRMIHAVVDGQTLGDIHALQAAEIGALRNPAWNALANTAAIGPLAMFFGWATIAGSASQTQKINRQIEQYFERMELTERILKSQETATGFVFFRAPTGGRSFSQVVVEITLEPEPLAGLGTKAVNYQFIMPIQL